MARTKGEDLPDLTPEELEFVDLLMFDKEINGNATEAFVRVYPHKKWTRHALNTAATKMKNRPQIKKWMAEVREASMDRLICSKEVHMAELAKLRDGARDSGNWGAAVNAELNRGKVAGHYVERKEITHKRDGDLDTLVQLAKGGEVTLALRYAEDLGLVEDLRKNCEGIWELEKDEQLPIEH